VARKTGFILGSALAAGLVALSGAREAWAFVPDGASVQPATELVMPFDATAGKASFLIVSNPYASSPGGGAKITTHWTFWGETCDELANLSMCLTERDTIVVDPTNMTALDENNEATGPTVDLTGKRGVVTVVAYETDEGCNAYDRTGEVLSRAGIVGTFTLADVSAGYSFGNDADGLNTDASGASVALPAGPAPGSGRYVLQTLSPKSVDASLAVFAWMGIAANRTAVPIDENATFYDTYYDNLEIATSLPDVSIDCVAFRSLTGGESPLIPDYVTPEGLLLPSYVVPASSGFLSLAPTPATGRLGDRYLFSFIGQAVGGFGASSHAKVQLD